MGMTGAKGKALYIDSGCPAADWAAPSGSGTAFADEVTKFDLVDSVLKRAYGHDKSGGWQDVCAGTRSVEVTLEAVISGTDVSGAGGETFISAGSVFYLILYPFGSTGVCSATPVAGYALVDKVSYTYDQETGKPCAYTATLSSKGPWTGLDDGDAWGGFECNCAP